MYNNIIWQCITSFWYFTLQLQITNPSNTWRVRCSIFWQSGSHVTFLMFGDVRNHMFTKLFEKVCMDSVSPVLYQFLHEESLASLYSSLQPGSSAMENVAQSNKEVENCANLPWSSLFPFDPLLRLNPLLRLDFPLPRLLQLESSPCALCKNSAIGLKIAE